MKQKKILAPMISHQLLFVLKKNPLPEKEKKRKKNT